MPTPEEPEQQPPENDQDPTHTETVNLVDLFDQMDRSSFLRALEQRDNSDQSLNSDG